VIDKLFEELKAAWFDVEWNFHETHSGVAVGNLARHEAIASGFGDWDA
jgi:hypothetical protein